MVREEAGLLRGVDGGGRRDEGLQGRDGRENERLREMEGVRGGERRDGDGLRRGEMGKRMRETVREEGLQETVRDSESEMGKRMRERERGSMKSESQ